MNYITAALALTAALTLSSAHAQWSDAEVLADVNTISGTLPITVDRLTTLTKLWYTPRTRMMDYTYSVAIPLNDLREVGPVIRSMSVQRFCSGPGTRSMLDAGLTLRHHYYARHTYAYSFTVTRANC